MRPIPAMPAGAATFNSLTGAAPIVIAHRGASGYQPEHKLAAHELAARLGADYIEPDVVITSDEVAIALHDTTLDRTTDVEARFARRSGGYDASQFTLAEIRTLNVDLVPDTPLSESAIPDFAPTSAGSYIVPMLQEVVDLVTCYSAGNGTEIGLYPELKTADSALNRIIVSTRFSTAEDKVYIQSFDLQTLHNVAEVQAALGSTVRQIAPLTRGSLRLRLSKVCRDPGDPSRRDPSGADAGLTGSLHRGNRTSDDGRIDGGRMPHFQIECSANPEACLAVAGLRCAVHAFVAVHGDLGFRVTDWFEGEATGFPPGFPAPRDRSEPSVPSCSMKPRARAPGALPRVTP